MKFIKQEEKEEEEDSKLFLTLMEGYSDSTIPLLSDLRTEPAIKAPSRKRLLNSSMEELFNIETQKRRMEACGSGKKPISSKAPLMEIHKEKQRREIKAPSRKRLLNSSMEEFNIEKQKRRMEACGSGKKPTSSKAPLMEIHKEKQRREIKAPSRKRLLNSSMVELFNIETQKRRMEACGSGKKPTSSKKPLMEIHKEKQRRDKVTTAYSILQAMVPNIPIKASRTMMVEETISYIQKLEEVLKELEAQKRKASSMAPPPTVAVSYNDFITLKKSIINVVVSGKIAVLGINSEIRNRRFLFSKVVSVFEKHSTEILTATVSVNGGKKMSLSATVLVNGNGGGKKMEGIKEDLIRLLGSRS